MTPVQPSDSTMVQAHPMADRPRPRSLAVRMAPGLCGVLIVAAVGLAWSIAVFGSPRQAWLHAGGVRYLVEPTSVAFPGGKPGDILVASFRVHNLSSRPLRILGAESSCSCVSSGSLPVTISARGAGEVRLTMHVEGRFTGNLKQTLTYLTDEPSAVRLRESDRTDRFGFDLR